MKPSEWEKEFEWTFEDYKNKNSFAYMVPTLGDIRKLKDFIRQTLAKEREAWVNQFMRYAENHYWDSLMGSESLILKHLEGIFNAIDQSIETVKDGSLKADELE